MTPFFLNTSHGALFALHHLPEQASRKALLLVPPFAEEMNKSRRMMHLAAVRAASLGVHALLLDLYGSGESEGDFSDATWDVWRANVLDACEWLRDEQGVQEIQLLGIRTGALLAAEIADQAGATVLSFWQPVLAGSQYMQQFLRLRLAGDGIREAVGENMAMLKERLSEGETLEVAGYDLSADLYRSLMERNLDLSPLTCPVYWFEIVAKADDSLSPARQKILEAIRAKGVDLQLQTIPGEPFWNTAEVTTIPELIDGMEQIL